MQFSQKAKRKEEAVPSRHASSADFSRPEETYPVRLNWRAEIMTGVWLWCGARRRRGSLEGRTGEAIVCVSFCVASSSGLRTVLPVVAAPPIGMGWMPRERKGNS